MKHRLTLFFIVGFAFVAFLPIASASVFDSMRDSIADALDSSDETAGYVLGFILVTFVFILASFLFRDSDNWKISVFMALFTVGFCILIGWFPVWVVVLLIIVFAVLLIGMPGSGGE